MSDKLKFKDEETIDDLTDAPEEAPEKPKPKRKNPVLDGDTPPDGETPIDDPAAEHEDGGELPDHDVDASEADGVIADDPAEPVESKLYERESSLKFSKEPAKPDIPEEKPVKKRQQALGVTGDHSTDDNLINKPVIPVEITEKAKKCKGTPEVDTDDGGNDDGDSVDTETETAEKTTTSTDEKNPKPPAVPAVPPIVPLVAAAPVAVTAGKLIKPKKPVKSASKLKFFDGEKPKTKEDKAKHREKLRAAKLDDKIGDLQYKTDMNAYKLQRAKEKQPTKKVKIRERVFDEKTGKSKIKLRFEEVAVPVNEAKWNLPKKQSLPVKGAAALTAAGVNKLHQKVHEVERENVGTQTAHKAELVGESAGRGGKKLIHSTHRFVKNTPYRQASKLEVKTVKSRIKLDYQKALKENPKLKSNALSRMFQKRKIKREYAAALRNAKKTGEKIKKTGEAVKNTGAVVGKFGKLVNAVVRKNPVFMLKAGLLLLIIIAIMSLLSMCVSIFSGGTGVIGGASYAADDGDITQAALAYSEWETDLQMEIINAETTHSGYDEYRYNIGYIGHDPLALMAYLTAVYQDFTCAEVESVMQGIFTDQYTLTFTPSMEIRYRTETRTDSWTDDEGNSHSYTYTVEVPYEWHILTVNLSSVSFTGILSDLMDDDQKEHYTVLMFTRGARQYGGSSFPFDWLPYVSSHYGYRVHPISGTKELHRGIDIGLPEGTEILAGLDGTVTTAAYDSGFGNYVVIEDGNGLVMKYAHCHTLLVTVGQPITRGDVLATVGTTGSSTGNHLHMEILKDGVYLNPLYFVESLCFD